MNTRPLSIGTILRNRYEIKQLVAGGGMAWVYRAIEHKPNGSDAIWAIKELRPESNSPTVIQEGGSLFEQEARILAQLRHKNLPSVAAFFEERGRSYLIMEFVTGESLQQRLKDANAPILQD